MSTVDQHSHLAVEEIAEYAEGLVTEPAAVAVIESHLAGCERCRQVRADLGETSALLAAEDVPPIPAVVAIQMEATLAAEVHERRIEERRLQAAGTDLPEPVLGIPAVGPAGGSPAHSAGIGGGDATVPAQPRSLSEHRRRRARMVSALAAAATVTAFAIGAAIFTQGMSGEDQLSSGAGVVEPQGPEAAEDTARGTYTGPTPATGEAYLSTSGQTFTAYTLSTSAQLLLSHRVRSGASAGGEVPATSPGVPSNAPPAPVGPGSEGTGPDMSFSGGNDRADLFSPAGLARCVAGLVPDPAAVEVLAVDLGQFDGQPAAMLVLSDPDDLAVAQVRVVNARCGLDQPVEFLRTEIARS